MRFSNPFKADAPITLINMYKRLVINIFVIFLLGSVVYVCYLFGLMAFNGDDVINVFIPDINETQQRKDALILLTAVITGPICLILIAFMLFDSYLAIRRYIDSLK